MLLAWLLLLGRLVQLQGIDRDRLAEQSLRQRRFSERIPARPGDILDRDGRVLATTVTVPSLFVVPSRVEDPRRLADRLAAVLPLDADRLFERIARRRDKHFLWVERQLDADQEAAVRALELPEEAWGFREEYLRSYPQGRLAAHVLGLRDIDGRGRGGVERAFDSLLRGRDGTRTLVRDARGRVIDVLERVDEAPRPGRDIALTLDTVVQLYAERELDGVMDAWKPRSACALVLDPKTGEVLAMASRPTFDPNRPGNAPENAWKNTAIASIYEPGSTFKPFVVAWALQQEVIRRDESFDCEHGEYRMGGRILHDHHPYGELSVTDILVKSSNIGMAKIGERLGNRGLHQAAVRFGFGAETGIPLPGELSGLVRPLPQWTSYSTGSIPMGQEIAVTPLQLVTAHAALANGGRLVAPRLLRRIAPGGRDVDQVERPRDGETEGQGQRSTRSASPSLRLSLSSSSRRPAPVVSQVVDPEIARWIVREPMTEIVRRGTGTKARLDGYTVFGKTGTAQKFDPETGRYSSSRHVSSFVCGAPSQDPQVLVLVVVNEPTVGTTHYGGEVAAPAAARILRKTLRHLGVAPQVADREPARP